jgi:hypothetical protein
MVTWPSGPRAGSSSPQFPIVRRPISRAARPRHALPGVDRAIQILRRQPHPDRPEGAYNALQLGTVDSQENMLYRIEEMKYYGS